MTPPWIQTRSGHAIDLTPPLPDQIVRSDLIWALAHLNRYTGHAGIYSVAQHLVMGARALRDEGHVEGVQRAYLGHDMHEGICGDVSSPGKRAIRHYYREALAEILREDRGGGLSDTEMAEDLDYLVTRYPDPWTRYEAACARAVRSRFGLPQEMPEAVKITDVRMLLTEKRDRMGPPRERDWIQTIPEKYHHLEPYGFRIAPWDPDVAAERLEDWADRLGVL